MPRDGKYSRSLQSEETERAFRQLCHLLSLDRGGKVQGAVESLILMVLYIDPRVGRCADPDELALAIATYFGVEIDVTAVRAGIENQLQTGGLLIDRVSAPNLIVLSADAKADVATRVENATQLESRVRADWIAEASEIADGADSDALWQALQSYLGLVFRQHGVEAIQLLDSTADGPAVSDTLGFMLDQAIKRANLVAHELGVKRAIAAFFHNNLLTRLRYMSELLDGTFTFFALTISDSTAEYLKGQIPSLDLFLDTNVILSMVGLQDNPMQDLSAELLKKIDAEGHPIQLHCHERTLQEISELQEAVTKALGAKRYSSQLSEAFVQSAESHASRFGVEARFHRLNMEHEIDVGAFLARFNHIEELAAAKKVRIYRPASSDSEEPAKETYIAAFEQFLQEYRPNRPRRYEARDHDVAVWISLQRLRSFSKNALRSGALLLSFDQALYSFDKSFLMNQPSGKKGPTVALPNHLLQLLRPLRKGSTDYDEQFLAVFATPEFRTAQSGYENTVTNVMKYLASFEDVPKETAVLILNDDLLMGRLNDMDAQSEEFAHLIEKTVLTENAALMETVTSLQDQLNEARQAQQALEQLANVEATNRAKIEQDLSKEHSRRELAEASAASAEASSARIATRARIAISVIIALAGSLLIIKGPGSVGWKGFLELHTHIAIQGLMVFAWLGVAYLTGPVKHRAAVLATVVIAAIIAALSLL